MHRLMDELHVTAITKPTSFAVPWKKKNRFILTRAAAACHFYFRANKNKRNWFPFFFFFFCCSTSVTFGQAEMFQCYSFIYSLSVVHQQPKHDLCAFLTFKWSRTEAPRTFSLSTRTRRSGSWHFSLLWSVYCSPLCRLHISVCSLSSVDYQYIALGYYKSCFTCFSAQKHTPVFSKCPVLHYFIPPLSETLCFSCCLLKAPVSSDWSVHRRLSLHR